MNHHAGLYCGADTCQRRQDQKARNQALLAAVSAVNELGQEYTLEDLAAVSVSNPEIRRAELMTRIAGFELVAVGLGRASELYTLTCPSKFHARSGNKWNPKYDLANTPREAQAYLCATWAPFGWRKISTQGRHRGMTVYGTSQRPAMIDKAFLGNCTHIRTSRLSQHTDRQTLARYLDVPLLQVAALNEHGRIQKDMSRNEVSTR